MPRNDIEKQSLAPAGKAISEKSILLAFASPSGLLRKADWKLGVPLLQIMDLHHF